MLDLKLIKNIKVANYSLDSVKRLKGLFNNKFKTVQKGIFHCMKKSQQFLKELLHR